MEPVNKMTKERMEKIRSVVIRILGGWGVSDLVDVDDITSHVIEALSTNFKRSIKYLMIDYVRQKHGRGGFGSKKASLRQEVLIGSVSDKKENLTRDQQAYKSYSYTPEYDLSIDYQAFLETLSPLDRSIMILKTMWGFSGREIAHVFGVHETRINQLTDELLQTAGGKPIKNAKQLGNLNYYINKHKDSN